MKITFEQITLLKGGGIIIIMLYHACGWLGLPNISQGQVGVDIFVFVSGYGISNSALKYKNQGLLFLKKRLISIYPYYLLVILIASYFLKPTLNDLALHLTLFQCVTAPYCFGIDNALWYMTLIAYLYIFVAIINRSVLEQYMVPLGFALAIVFLFLYKDVQPIISHLVPRMPVFFIGYYVADLVLKKDKGNFARALIPIMAIIYFFISIKMQPGFFTTLGLAVFFSMVFVQLSNVSFINKILMYFGIYSYQIYLVHDFAMRYAISVAAPHNQYWKYLYFSGLSLLGICFFVVSLQFILNIIKRIDMRTFYYLKDCLIRHDA